MLANHIWSFEGDDDRADVDATFLQPFLTYTTPTQWTLLAVNTESSYDWKNEQWSVPVNANVSKLLRFGSQLVSLGGGVRYWLDSPDSGPCRNANSSSPAHRCAAHDRPRRLHDHRRQRRGDPAAQRKSLDAAADSALARLYRAAGAPRSSSRRRAACWCFRPSVSAGFLVGGGVGTGVPSAPAGRPPATTA